jgi:hypothetical protein
MMKKHIKIALVLLLFIVTSCGISEDCFKGNGNRVSHNFPLEGFTKVKVYDGVGLVIKEGPNYEVRVETSNNIISDLDVKIEDDMLVVKDNSTCNITREYGQTIVYVTTPSLTEIHSKTEQDIKSDGVLHYPTLKLFSIDLSDGAGTGDFFLTLNCFNFFIESNNVSNFNITGYCKNSTVAIYWGGGQVNCSDLEVENKLTFFHRGANNMILNISGDLEGNIYSTGDVILVSNPNNVNVIEHFTGRLIIQ